MSDNSASNTKILGLPIYASDTTQLPSGSILTYDSTNRQFKFIPGGGVAGVSSLNGLTGALTIVAGSNISVSAIGSNITISASGGAGTVTSVALTAPGEFSVSGSPVTAAGTLAITKVTQVANTVWAGPTSGGAAQPTFRALVSADIPGGAATFADAEVPTGTINSSNKVFTLAVAPNPTGSLELFLNGVLQTQGIDYTLAVLTITYTSAPSTGDTHVAWYRH